MRTLLLVLSFICAMNLFAQDYSIKSVSLLQSDLRASTNLRNDNDGKPCAIIKVNVIGMTDLNFPEAIGNVEYSLGEYSVYVPENLKKFTMHSSGKKFQEEIIFDDYGIEEIEGKRVYRIVLESNDNTRAAIFSIYPQNATLKFNGKEIKLDKSGMALIEERIGEYSYEVSADGYVVSSGKVSLIEDDIATTTNVVLQQIKHPLILSCNVDNAVLYIDDVTLGALDEVETLDLTVGNHILRLVSPGYKDYEQQIHVDGEVELNVTMNELKQKVIKYREERSRTRVNIRNAHYVRFGGELYNKDKYFGLTCGVKLEYSYSAHFLAIGEFRSGISVGVLGIHHDAKSELYGNPSISDLGGFLEIPLQFGLGIPFGKYNSHLLSFLVGGYGKGYYLGYRSDYAKEDHNLYELDGSSVEYNYKKDVYDYDYGLRASMKLDISKFSISFEFSQSLNDGGFYPGIALGWKIY